MIVFPHGGVLRMSTQVNVGQMLVLTNVKTRQDAICRVVKVRSYSNSASYVEVEFTHKQAGYWGVYFESESVPPEPTAVSSAPVAGSAAGGAKSSASGPGASPTRTASDDSTFIHFGSQEEVQLSASSMASASASLSSSSGLSSTPAKLPLSSAGLPAGKKSAEAVASGEAKGSAESSPAASEVEAISDPLPESSNPRTARAGEAFGSRLGAGPSSDGQAESGTNWVLIGLGGAALVIAIVVGAVFFGHKPSSSPASEPQTVTQQAAAPQPVAVPSAPVTVTPTSSGSRPNVTPTATSQPVSMPAKPAKQMAVVRESGPVSEPAAQPEPAPAPAPAASAPSNTSKASMPSVFGTLNAHPVAQSRSVNTAAPNVEATVASAAPENALLGITSPANGSSLPAPAFNPNIPVAVGGRVRQPALIKNVVPQYPTLARQAHTQGDVTVQIVIDRSGNVTEGKAISGPTVLRQAAVDAVRGWKYEPTMLDGQAISVQMLVTLRFQL
jgi:TonB family protein